ncbi:MAG: ribonuclease R [Verrucomicrobiae bacterium]|nr:ribonuclease R [Verrucomicrobiae bacterium]
MNPKLTRLKARIQQHLARPGCPPLRVSELVERLRIPPPEREGARRAVDALVREGVIVRVRRDRLVLPSQADLVTGCIEMNERGFGFVVPEPAAGAAPAGDVFVSAEDTGTAMHGDRVVARLHAEAGSAARDDTRGPRRRGHVIRILERANAEVLGVLQRGPRFHHVVPDDPRLGRDIYVDLQKSRARAKAGDRVVVRLSEWTNRHVNPEGVIAEVIGPSDDPRLDSVAVLRKYGLRTEFPAEAVRQADAAPDRVAPEEIARRTDWRREQVVTIDPDDARDHDDALSLKRLSNGRWLAGVHIADVSHYVTPGSPLDREARLRGNSVYLPDRVIPMLPPRLSNGICSLVEREDRLAFSVFFEMDDAARVLARRFEPSIIRSSARLTYRQAYAALDPKRTAPPVGLPPATVQLIRDLWGLASRLRARRFAEGSLDLDFPEVKVRCDARGVPVKIEKVENDASHQLVEEFMLLANEAVASEARRREAPCVHRVHEDPDPEKLEDWRELARACGHPLGDPNVRGEIQKLLKRIAGAPEESLIKMNLLRSLKRARYDVRPLGHYGLAKSDYAHFTSPIRRYADLVVHRALRRALGAKGTGSGSGALGEIAEHCSAAERVADEAEKEVVRMKIIEFFERQLSERRFETFAAVITDVRNFGLFVELPEFMVSGLIRVSAMENDFYRFDAARQRMTGRRTRRVLHAGQPVRVTVVRVDRFKKQVDFRLAD